MMHLDKKKSTLVALMILLFLLLLIILLMNRCTQLSEETDINSNLPIASAEDWSGERDYSEKEEQSSIAIPGYDVIPMKADQIDQQVNFYNPEQNSCYFKLTLTLEDGTVLWESDLLEPSKAFYDIQLKQTVKAGTYNASLSYQCFSLAEQKELNGAKIAVKLAFS